MNYSGFILRKVSITDKFNYLHVNIFYYHHEPIKYEKFIENPHFTAALILDLEV